MTVTIAPWVDPAELAAAKAEDPTFDATEDRWCFGCGLRPDRSPLAGGCGCRRHAELPNACPDCGGRVGYWNAPEFACYCRPPWETP